MAPAGGYRTGGLQCKQKPVFFTPAKDIGCLQRSLWKGPKSPPVCPQPTGFLFSEKEFNSWAKDGRNLKHQNPCLQIIQGMPCGTGTLQSRRPSRPDEIVKGNVPHFMQRSVAEQWQQGRAPLAAGCHASSLSIQLAFAFLLFQGVKHTKGNGCPRNQVATARCNTVVIPMLVWSQSSSEGCKQGTMHASQGTSRLYLRIRNHLKWWEEHSSKDLLTLIRRG